MNILRALFLDDLIEFVDFWFNHLPRKIIRNYFDRIYFFEKYLGLKSNLRNILKPLYGDYTIIGHIIALIYRVIKIIFVFIFYLFLGFFYLIILLFILFLPILLLIYGDIF